MVASTSKTEIFTKSTGLKQPIQPTLLSLSQSQRKVAANVQASATSTRSTPTTSQHASVGDVEDNDITNDGNVFDRDGDSLIELSDDETS
jgi:hypothetical protein